jgi:predicted lipase
MKSIFNKTTRDELIVRINSLNDNNNIALWGKMNLFQMLKHCTLWDEMILGKIKVKRMFLGRIFGKIALKEVLKNDNPLGKNSPTSSELMINEKSGDIALQKKALINSINEYEHFNNQDFIHPFFGTMTKEQIGFFVYKHSDHHLRQFGA